MKTVLAVALFAVCAFAEGVAGHWQVSMDSPHGPMKGSLEFKLDGSKLTGTAELGPNRSFPLKGEVDGEKIEIEFNGTTNDEDAVELKK